MHPGISRQLQSAYVHEVYDRQGTHVRVSRRSRPHRISLVALRRRTWR